MKGIFFREKINFLPLFISEYEELNFRNCVKGYQTTACQKKKLNFFNFFCWNHHNNSNFSPHKRSKRGNLFQRILKKVSYIWKLSVPIRNMRGNYRKAKDLKKFSANSRLSVPIYKVGRKYFEKVSRLNDHYEIIHPHLRSIGSFWERQQKKFFEKISNFLMLKKFIRPHLRSIEG